MPRPVDFRQANIPAHLRRPLFKPTPGSALASTIGARVQSVSLDARQESPSKRLTPGAARMFNNRAPDTTGGAPHSVADDFDEPWCAHARAHSRTSGLARVGGLCSGVRVC